MGHFLAALDNVIDLHEARVTVGLVQRTPRGFLMVLFILSALASGMLGLRSGLVRTRSTIPVVIYLVANTIVLALIVDIDRPVSGCSPSVSRR